jgi:hypothetical protein
VAGTRWGWAGAALTPLRALGVAALAAGAVAAGLPPAAVMAAPLRDCTRSRGTIVVVDFGHWGGPVLRGCGRHASSDYDLLHTAGFTTAGDAHDGPAFICRLGDAAFHGGAEYPTPAQQSCIHTPPASAYWSYWRAPAGQNHWSYSQLGAMSEVPRPGEVELWTFGDTNIAGTRGSGVPSVSPNSLRAAATGPHVLAARPTAQHAASGSAVPLVIGALLVVLLGAGAVWTVRMRRREE